MSTGTVHPKLPKAASNRSSGPSSNPTPAPAIRLALAGRRRRPAVLALGLALVGLGGAGAALVATTAGGRQPVLAVVRAVDAGSVISSADLGEAKIAPDPRLSPIRARDRADAVGRLAAVDLRPGTLLTRGELSSVDIPGPGQVLVGLALKPGQLPARPLRHGDPVLVVVGATPDAVARPAVSSGDGSTVGAGRQATVAEVGPPSSDGAVVVDLVVRSGDGALLAAESSGGRLSLVLLPRGPTP